MSSAAAFTGTLKSKRQPYNRNSREGAWQVSLHLSFFWGVKGVEKGPESAVNRSQARPFVLTVHGLVVQTKRFAPVPVR